MAQATRVANVSELKNVIALFPKLTGKLRKGDSGKVGVIGGAPEYTGAPYFASITSMKIGADLVYVFCHPDASPVIKSYSPELIVHPTLDFARIEPNMSRLDALVFGPGIGREKSKLVPLLENVLEYVRRTPKLCLIIDADGLFLLLDCIDSVKGCKNVLLTPNHREFQRLYKSVFPEREGDEADDVKALASKLGVNIIRKGEDDVITDGDTVRLGQQQGNPRRCGGQGDLLDGCVALFCYWAKLRRNEETFTSEHMLEGAHAASDFIRFTSRKTFFNIGRSINAADIIAGIPDVVREIDAYIEKN
ncbi:YjeF [Aphelenchoides avenae]|nr:YjeF [Aphelenchus avenae]